MNAPLSEITIYTPIGVIIPNGNSHTFPITDSCERNATLMNDDYIKLSFSLPQQVIFPAFAFIRYDGNSPETNQYFFLKEDYLPADKGGYFEYEMTFVSFANMLSKSICHRHIEVTDTNGNVTETWDEPEINLNATLEVMADVILQSIHQAALRLPSCKYTTMLKALIIGNLQQDTSLLTYSFSGETIYNVLSKVADMNEVEWYIDHETTTPLLHIAKCERYDTISLTDHFSKTGNHLQLYRSGGLLSCEYSQKWTDIPQYLIPYGSERNMTRKTAIANVAGAEMYVSYGKRLRLNRYDDNGNLVDYKIKDENGNTITIHAGEHGEIENEEVTTGIEIVEMFDDVYPRCHYQVVAVSVEGSEETPKYVITAQAIDEATGNLLTGTQMVSAGLMPITLQEGQTLTIVFESGYLNGREFEVNDRSFKVSGKASWNLILSIMAEGGDEDDAPMIPFGTFIPRVGDKFAMFGMEMPSGYIANAKQELAQKAYDKMLEIEQSRPEVKCTADPNEFGDIRLVLGQRISVQSDIFGTNAFVSRVTSFSHSLTTPNVVTFKLASSRVVGRIAEIQQAIADRTNDIKGLEQRTINISRRGWRDATEMADKLETLAAEMMLVGVEKYQFVFTSSIYTNDTVEGVYTKKFQSLVITAGTLQHTQKPYIDYSNKGVWNIPARNLTETQYGNGNTLDPDTSYYVYAVCEVPNAATNPDNECEILLSATALTGTQYLLMGILSSEFDDTYDESNKTRQRVFNRSNGYTQIAGGTITTEQLQDAGRNLIIDFQSNPPRIIARNNAEIIGNIRFKAGDSQTAEEQLKALGLLAEDAQSTAQNAQAAVDNMEVGGENLYYLANPLTQTATSTNNYYYYILLENLEIGKKYTFSCEKSVRLAGTATKYTIRLYNFATNTTAQYYDLSIGNTRQTCTFTVPAVSGNYCLLIYAGVGGSTAGNSLQWTDIMIQKGDKTTAYQQPAWKPLYNQGISISYDKYDEAVYKDLLYNIPAGTYKATMAYESKGDGAGQDVSGAYANSCIAWYKAGSESEVLAITDWGETVHIEEAADVVIYTGVKNYITEYIATPGTLGVYFPAAGTWSITAARIITYVTDSIAGSAAALDYLKAALTDGSTQVAGGLLMTNVLMLKNLAGAVTAGMSGLTKKTGTSTADNVLLWGGGNYEEAFYAANNANYYKSSSGTTPITTLIKKDGTGKIGIFRISDDEVIIDNGGSKTIITTDTIANIASTNNIGLTTLNETYSSTTITSQQRVLFERTFNGTLTGTIRIPYLYVTVGVTGTDDLRQATAVLKITVTYNGGQTAIIKNETIYVSSTHSSGSTIITMSNYTNSYAKIQSFKIELASGSQTLYGKIDVYFNCYVGTAGNSQTAVIAKDGMMVSSEKGGRFIVSPNGDNMSVVADLPIVSTLADVNKLSVGQLFTDSSGIVRRYSLDDDLGGTDREFVSIGYLKNNVQERLSFSQFRTTSYMLTVNNAATFNGTVTMAGLAASESTAGTNALYKYSTKQIRHKR